MEISIIPLLKKKLRTCTGVGFHKKFKCFLITIHAGMDSSRLLKKS